MKKRNIIFFLFSVFILISFVSSACYLNIKNPEPYSLNVFVNEQKFMEIPPKNFDRKLIGDMFAADGIIEVSYKYQVPGGLNVFGTKGSYLLSIPDLCKIPQDYTYFCSDEIKESEEKKFNYFDATVYITVIREDYEASGTGVIIGKFKNGDGLVLTAAHTFEKMIDIGGKAKVSFHDGEEREGILLDKIFGMINEKEQGFDADLAILRVKYHEGDNYPIAPILSRNQVVKPGIKAFFIGCSGYKYTNTQCKVIESEYVYPTIVANFTAIYGDSGGGLFTSQGLLIGILIGGPDKQRTSLFSPIEEIHYFLDKQGFKKDNLINLEFKDFKEIPESTNIIPDKPDNIDLDKESLIPKSIIHESNNRDPSNSIVKIISENQDVIYGGSGVIIGKNDHGELIILTVADELGFKSIGQKVDIGFYDNKKTKGAIIDEFDSYNALSGKVENLALIKVCGSDYPSVSLFMGDISEIKVNQDVLRIGFSQAGLEKTNCIIKSLENTMPLTISTDTELKFGESGSGLFNKNNELIGYAGYYSTNKKRIYYRTFEEINNYFLERKIEYKGSSKRETNPVPIPKDSPKGKINPVPISEFK